mmetsp:Transcript_32168/g.90452  ORF Transcript_32168/g.90452 Transcript_32168/m.90452 type:complete len:212 (-) Transcript_32168:8-643(-)
MQAITAQLRRSFKSNGTDHCSDRLSCKSAQHASCRCLIGTQHCTRAVPAEVCRRCCLIGSQRSGRTDRAELCRRRRPVRSPSARRKVRAKICQRCGLIGSQRYGRAASAELCRHCCSEPLLFDRLGAEPTAVIVVGCPGRCCIKFRSPGSTATCGAQCHWLCRSERCRFRWSGSGPPSLWWCLGRSHAQWVGHCCEAKSPRDVHEQLAVKV